MAKTTQRMKRTLSVKAIQYFQINAELPVDVSPVIDEAPPENLDALKEPGTYTARIFDAQLDAVVELLV